jgi:hypothetical protein
VCVAARRGTISVENVLEQVLGDAAVGCGDVVVWPPVEAVVERVQHRAEVAAHVEPPVAYEHRLVELGAVGTEEGRLPPINVAVVPCLQQTRAVPARHY